MGEGFLDAGVFDDIETVWHMLVWGSIFRDADGHHYRIEGTNLQKRYKNSLEWWRAVNIGNGPWTQIKGEVEYTGTEAEKYLKKIAINYNIKPEVVDKLVEEMDRVSIKPHPKIADKTSSPTVVNAWLDVGFCVKTQANLRYKKIDGQLHVYNGGTWVKSNYKYLSSGDAPFEILSYLDLKPERKRLTYEEALKADVVEVEWPDLPAHIKSHTYYKNSEWGNWDGDTLIGWDEDARCNFDLAERRGYPMYKAG